MNNNSVKRWLLIVFQNYFWFPVLVFTIHIVAIKTFNAYEIFPQFDIPMHFLGGVSIAYFFHGLYCVAKQQKLLGNPAWFFHELFIFSFAGTATIFWEFSEFLSDKYFNTGLQEGVADTMGDLLLGLIGAVIFLLINKIFIKSRTELV